MPKVKIETNTREFGGSTSFEEHHLRSKSDNPYNMDLWFYVLGHYFDIICSADRQIIHVGGYMPCHNWIRKESIDVPEPLAKCNFVIDEEFCQSGRVASEDEEPTVDYCPEQSIARINISHQPIEFTEKLFVSPHKNLLVGATKSTPMIATEFILLNVCGIAAS